MDLTPDPLTLEERMDLILNVPLDGKQVNGSPFELEDCRFNMKEKGRGLNSFQKVFATCQGRPLTDDELDNFDYDALLKGKEVFVAVKHKKVGTKLVAYIASFHPVESLVAQTA